MDYEEDIPDPQVMVKRGAGDPFIFGGNADEESSRSYNNEDSQNGKPEEFFDEQPLEQIVNEKEEHESEIASTEQIK